MTAEQAPRFDFYEKVLVSTSARRKARINGKLGVVSGRAQDEAGRWFYSVHIYRLDTSWYLPENELVPTGEFDREETFYDGTSIRVRVDDKGRGIVVDPSDE